MWVTWNPEDGTEPVEFVYDPDELFSKEAVMIEKQYGEPIDSFFNGLRMKEARARRILLWWWMRKTHGNLQFKDVPDFRMRQMKCQMSVTELRELWNRLAKTKMEDERREDLRAAFEVDIRDAMAREGLLEGDVEEGVVALPKPA